MKPGDIFRDTRWGPELHLIGVVTYSDGHSIEGNVMKFRTDGRLVGVDCRYCALASDVVALRDVVEIPTNETLTEMVERVEEITGTGRVVLSPMGGK